MSEEEEAEESEREQEKLGLRGGRKSGPLRRGLGELASGDSIFASSGQLGCGIWKPVQPEPVCYTFQLLIVHFRAPLLGFVVKLGLGSLLGISGAARDYAGMPVGACWHAVTGMPLGVVAEPEGAEHLEP